MATRSLCAHIPQKFPHFLIVALTTIFFCSKIVASSTIYVGGNHMSSQSGDHSYMKSFSIIHRFSVMYHIKALKEYHLHGHQMGYILHVCQHPGISQEKLASYLGLNKGSVAKGLRPLIAEGYIQRRQNQKDRRAYRLFPTEKAQALLVKCDQIVEQFNDILTASMSNEEKQTFQRLVTKACCNVMAASEGQWSHLEHPGGHPSIIPPVPPDHIPCRRTCRRGPGFHSLMCRRFRRNG